MGRIDLHSHSRYSDGTATPAEVVRRAKGRGVEFLVLSDHDTVSGFPEARAEGEKLGVRVFCGMEINTREDDQVHVLGYGIDERSSALAQRLQQFRDRRRLRIGLILERLRACGIDVRDEDVAGVSQETLGRPHVADALRRKGVVSSRKEAFQRFLVKGAPAYVEPMGPSVEEAIATIREAGGWSSLAHPGLMKKTHDLERWVSAGLGGLEVYYPAHTRPQTDRLFSTAKQFRLTPTGGSDFHGPGSGRDEIGCVDIPKAVIDELVAKIGRAD